MALAQQANADSTGSEDAGVGGSSVSRGEPVVSTSASPSGNVSSDEKRSNWVRNKDGELVAPENVEQQEEIKGQCVRDEDCDNYPYYLCGTEHEGVCTHKGVFPFYGLEIGGMVIFALIMGLSNVAGIGGGGVAIPLIMAFHYFQTKPAIAISSMAILVCTVTRWLMNFNQRHPEKKNVIVIDYGLACIMMPTTLAGSQVGAIILVTFPSIAI